MSDQPILTPGVKSELIINGRDMNSSENPYPQPSADRGAVPGAPERTEEKHETRSPDGTTGQAMRDVAERATRLNAESAGRIRNANSDAGEGLAESHTTTSAALGTGETPDPTIDYWQKALDLVADTLMTDVSETSDEKLAEKRDKLGAIVRNAVHWWRGVPAPPAVPALQSVADAALFDEITGRLASYAETRSGVARRGLGEAVTLIREIQREWKSAVPAPPDMQALTFMQFSQANRTRCESPQGFNHALKDWDTSDWFLAVLGELGEAANVAKKLNRVRDGIPGNKETPDELRAKLRKEVGDVFVYLDLLAQAHDFTVDGAAVEVFDAKSREIGYSVSLAASSGSRQPPPMPRDTEPTR